MMFVPHWKHTPSRPLAGTALLFYMQMMFVPHWKHTPSQLVTGTALIFYMQMMFLPHSKHMYKTPKPLIEVVLHLMLYIFNIK
jgi:hypothetical protein